MPDYDKVLGCLAGAAIGDAMGAATEGKSHRQIAAMFGGKVAELQPPPADCPAAGRKRGTVTDAFSIPYYLTKHLLAAGGLTPRTAAEEALREWGKTDWFDAFAGMTTRKAVIALTANGDAGSWAHAGHLGNKRFKSHYYALSSNGAAVKAYPAALLHPGDIPSAVRMAAELTMASHDDVLSISGACAVAAAVSRAFLSPCTAYNLIQAALDGERLGKKLALQQNGILSYPGPSVGKRLQWAVQLAVSNTGNPIESIRDAIGSGPAIAETVPAAFGLLVATHCDPMAAIIEAVNLGDETSAIASLCGAISGALKGAKAFPRAWLEEIESVNGLDIQGQARRISHLKTTGQHTGG